MSERIALSRNLSLSLDVVRALAALYVVVHHVAAARNGGTAPLPLRFGQEAVIVFFLLSGFVIHANERGRAARPWPFYKRRLLRIYPTLVAAMATSAAVLWWNGTLAREFRPVEMVGTLLGLQDIGDLKPGTWVEPFLGNSPLWSLSYELAFYAIYPVVLRPFLARPRATHDAIGLGCLLALAAYNLWPSHAFLVPGYFVVWWVGAMGAEACREGNRRDLGRAVAWLAACTALWAAVVAWRGGPGPIGVYPTLMLRHFGVALIFVAVAASPVGRWVLRAPMPFAPVWSFLASISYGLYLLHVPVLIQWAPAGTPAGLAVAAGLLVVLAWVFDRLLQLGLRGLRRSGPVPRGGVAEA